MSNAKFTPGPWRFSTALNCISTTATNIRQDVICDVDGSIYKSLVKPENAHLIAAAPEMYEALLAFVSNSTAQTYMLDECESAEAILLKVRGLES